MAFYCAKVGIIQAFHLIFLFFEENVEFHEYESRKTEVGNGLVDNLGEQRTYYPINWGILADKGYQGAMELVRVIHTKKKPANGELTRSVAQRNGKVSSDRIFGEKYIGRLCSLWYEMSGKRKCCERNYDAY